MCFLIYVHTWNKMKGVWNGITTPWSTLPSCRQQRSRYLFLLFLGSSAMKPLTDSKVLFIWLSMGRSVGRKPVKEMIVELSHESLGFMRFYGFGYASFPKVYILLDKNYKFTFSDKYVFFLPLFINMY